MKPVEFYNVTRKLLEQRLQMVKNGAIPPFSDMRHFWYECRNLFLRENPTLTEPDSKSKQLYTDWEKTIKEWCKKHAEELGYDKDVFWRVREALNIWAEGRALCQGESGEFLVTRKTRSRVANDCSFILCCEKKTVSQELLQRLTDEGYKVNLVSTAGQNPSDVQEVVMAIAEELGDDQTFYILVLHDYDLDGLKIYFNLKQRYEHVLDVGVNRDLFKELETDLDKRLIEEQKLNKNYQWWLKNQIEEDGSYDLEDFQYLQGKQITRKRWVGKRIEIDAIHVQYGIEPFIKYILKKISEECTVWDLTRIGVKEFELYNPDNPFEAKENNWRWGLQSFYKEKLKEISKPMNAILDKVKELTSASKDNLAFWGLAETYWIIDENYEVQFREINDPFLATLKKKYAHKWNIDWTENYEYELQKINEQVHRYHGDVRGAKGKLEANAQELQEAVNEDTSEDVDVLAFDEELREIYCGENELDEIKAVPLTEQVKMVIDGLRVWLKELAAEGIT